jgi:hypothetical protein
MSYSIDRSLFRPWCQVVALLAFAAGTARADSLEQQIDRHLEQVRAIRVVTDEQLLDQYNKEMDTGWRLYAADKVHSLPILRSRLKTETAAPHPSDLVVLDTGYYVYLNDQAEGKALALDALAHLNFQDPIVVANNKELFEFLHEAAKDHAAAALPLIERAFLGSRESTFIPAHALKLDATLICVFLYGAYGPESEDRLRQKLTDKAVTKRALEVLAWIGTPASFPEVSRIVTDEPNYEVFARATSYMMQVAGPVGRNYLLSLDPKKLDARSQQYLAKVRKDIESTSVETFKAVLSRAPGEEHLSDADVLKRLDLMLKNFGVDDKTSPVAVLNSGLPAQVLIDKLVAIRTRTLFRLSDEALSDVEANNMLLVALRYRGG